MTVKDIGESRVKSSNLMDDGGEFNELQYLIEKGVATKASAKFWINRIVQIDKLIEDHELRISELKKLRSQYLVSAGNDTEALTNLRNLYRSKTVQLV